MMCIIYLVLVVLLKFIVYVVFEYIVRVKGFWDYSSKVKFKFNSVVFDYVELYFLIYVMFKVY